MTNINVGGVAGSFGILEPQMVLLAFLFHILPCWRKQKEEEYGEGEGRERRGRGERGDGRGEGDFLSLFYFFSCFLFPVFLITFH